MIGHRVISNVGLDDGGRSHCRPSDGSNDKPDAGQDAQQAAYGRQDLHGFDVARRAAWGKMFRAVCAELR